MVRKKCKKLMNDQNFEEGNFMDFFGVLTMLGGLALFLYGMETMGKVSKSFPVEDWKEFLKN